MGLCIPWALHWTPDTLSGSHPTLPSWTVHHWKGDPSDILKTSINTFLLQMLDDRPVDLENASRHHLDGWSINIPIPDFQQKRCDLWDALWRIRIMGGVSERVLCDALGVRDTHDIVMRLSPIRTSESWSTWHDHVYSVLTNPPW